MLELEGVRVLELSIAWAGPLAGRWMGDLGADVIKIEHPTSRGLSVLPPVGEREPWVWGELPAQALRNGIFPDNEPGEHWWNRIGHFNKINRNKRSLCLDIKGPGGRAVLEALVRQADVVLNNYSPRGVRSLGIDHETLRAINPRIVTVSLSGFGATGPAAEQVSWGPILDAGSGLASATGYADSGPYKQGLALPDAIGGLHGAVAILAALWERERTGEAVHVDVSQLETLLSVGGELLLEASVMGQPERRGNRSATVAPQGVYRCIGPDEWLALSIGTDQEWEAFLGVLGDPELELDAYRTRLGRLSAQDAIDVRIGLWSAQRSKHIAMAELQAVGVRAGAVMTNADLVEDPHLAERGFFVDLDQVDHRALTFPGVPVHFDEWSPSLHSTPPLGWHNREILRSLGYDAAAISALEASGTIADRPPGA